MFLLLRHEINVIYSKFVNNPIKEEKSIMLGVKSVTFSCPLVPEGAPADSSSPLTAASQTVQSSKVQNIMSTH